MMRAELHEETIIDSEHKREAEKRQDKRWRWEVERQAWAEVKMDGKEAGRYGIQEWKEAGVEGSD